MDFSQPFGGLMPGARGAALAVLLRAGTGLTGRQVHSLAASGHSLSATQQALRDLAEIGMTTITTVGRSGVHQLNESHIAVAPLRALASPIAMLRTIASDTCPDATAVVTFGSVARGEATKASDIDIAIIGPAAHDTRATLQQAIAERLGNDSDVLAFTEEEFHLLLEAGEPVTTEILRDGFPLIGEMPRRRHPKAS